LISGTTNMGLFITYDAPGPQWRLGPPPAERDTFALIGWTADAREGGVPGAVVDVLARSLTAFGRVTFACSTISTADSGKWQMHGSDFVARYRAGSLFHRMAGRFSSRAPHDLVLLSTVSEQAARQLFDDAGYPWWGQGQFALMSSDAASPPDFAKVAFDPATLLEGEWPEDFEELQPLGVQAMLRPGVDGDVAGLLCASRDIRDRFETILARAAQDFGISLRQVSEAEFSTGLASPPS
jgi:hypothetical protein